VRNCLAKGRYQSRAGRAKFIAMRKRKALEEAFAARGDAQQDFARVGVASGAFEQSLRFEAAAQFNRAMVANLQALGERANGGGQRGRQSFQGKQSLVLLGLDAGGAGGILAEIQEAADFVAESRESPVVDGAAAHGHAVIISYYDIN